MAKLTIEFSGLTAKSATEVKTAIAHVYGVEATADGLGQAIAQFLIRPAIDTYRRRADNVDLSKAIADFGSDLGDPE